MGDRRRNRSFCHDFLHAFTNVLLNPLTHTLRLSMYEKMDNWRRTAG